MKRGKDDEKKNGGPMFPRLHVNDTDKGGPRAPPRNKMALYEQLSVPSQRFNSSAPPNPNSSTNSGYPHSSSQVGGRERSTFSPLQLPPSSHPVEKSGSRYSDVNNQTGHQEQKKKQDEDDFRVPIFVQSGITQDRRGNHLKRGNEGHVTSTPAPVNSSNTSHSVKHHYASKRDPKGTDAIDLNLTQEHVTFREDNPPKFVAGLEQSVKSLSNQTHQFSSFGMRNNVSKSYSQLQSNENVQPDCGAELQRDNTLWGDSVSNEGRRVIEAQPEILRIPNDAINGDAVSETSMVDSISGIDISPDDVVGIIGQKHFWKARRAIVNQQRVFAVQVFELHRLLKVQKLIAGSPQLLVEENAYSGKPLKVIPAKKLPLEIIVKPTPNISKRKDISEKTSQNVEFSAENAYLGKPVKITPAKKLPLEIIVKPTPIISKRKDDDIEKTSQYVEVSAENAVEKTSPSSVQNGGQPSSYIPSQGDPQTTADPNMGPWGFNQQPGHQWLIPVMTPSEGLVYKPYPGPGFMSPVCGGCGPPGSTPMMGPNFMNYGVPPPPHHHYQGLGIPPFAPPPSHGYFPPYGMSSMNPSISSSAGQHMHNFNTQYQNSSNIPPEVPHEKNETAVPKVRKFSAFKESEIQVSTASSPSERTRERNPLTLFPTSRTIQFPERVPDQPRQVVDPPSRVIRVVPHNARSATASVARIFQSIQEERKQYDSV